MTIKEISVAELVTFHKHGIRVVDVRETDEYESGHVPGAVHVALSSIPEHISKFQFTEPVYLVCRSGGRSMQACEFLHDAGVTNVVNVAGGTMGWITSGNDVVLGDQPG